MNTKHSHKNSRGPRKEKFTRTVFNDFRSGDLKRSLGQEYREFREYYLDEDSRTKLAGMNWFKRAFFFIAWLMKSLYFKLTPFRRVLLLISIFLFFLNDVVFEFGRWDVKSNVGMYSYLILLFVLMLELKDKLLAREELEEGRGVQEALLPKDNPSIPGWEVWLYTQSANEVGGDLVDYIKLNDGKWGIVLGDVAGKGLGAALFMAKIQATLRALALDYGSLADLGQRMNKILCRDGIPNRFATMLYLEVGQDRGTVRFLNAGHFPPLIVRGGKLEHAEPLAMALGVTTDSVYREQSVDLSENDLLIGYSDGMTEAANESGEFFGEERLFKLLEGRPNASARDTGECLLAELKKFVGNTRASDDISLIILRKLP